MRTKRIRTLFFLICLLALPWPQPLSANTLETEEVILDDATVRKGYTAAAFGGQLKLGVRDGVLSAGTGIRFKKNPPLLHQVPDGQRIISDILEYDVLDKASFTHEKPLFVELSFDSDSADLKKVHFWDSGRKSWRPLPGLSNNEKKFARGVIHLPFARLAVIETPNAMELGRASWYRYRDCDCAASPDYKRGTRLKVTNEANKKSVIVTVNDYGPERDIHPDRVIDLDKTAFAKLASVRAGIIDVRVEPVEEKTQSLSLASVARQADDPFAGAITAKAAVVVDAKTGEVLWGKEHQKPLPIASLTKLMTAQVFHDTGTPWDKVGTYRSYDNEPGSKLYVYPGETMTARDLYFSMLTSSTNNAVNTLVRTTALGEGQIVDLMNARARAWGLANTVFYETTGLNPLNQSTAYEVALLSRQALSHMEVLQATTIPSYTFATINTGEAHTMRNTNPLVGDSELYLTGGKTGFLDEAGYCLMTRAKGDDGQEALAVVLGAASADDRAQQVKMLLEWGLAELAK